MACSVITRYMSADFLFHRQVDSVSEKLSTIPALIGGTEDSCPALLPPGSALPAAMTHNRAAREQNLHSLYILDLHHLKEDS